MRIEKTLGNKGKGGQKPAPKPTPKKAPKKSGKKASSRVSFWDDKSHLDRLIRLYKKYQSREGCYGKIAKELGVSKSAVYHKAGRIGLYHSAWVDRD